MGRFSHWVWVAVVTSSLIMIAEVVANPKKSALAIRLRADNAGMTKVQPGLYKSTEWRLFTNIISGAKHDSDGDEIANTIEERGRSATVVPNGIAALVLGVDRQIDLEERFTTKDKYSQRPQLKEFVDVHEQLKNIMQLLHDDSDLVVVVPPSSKNSFRRLPAKVKKILAQSDVPLEELHWIHAGFDKLSWRALEKPPALDNNLQYLVIFQFVMRFTSGRSLQFLEAHPDSMREQLRDFAALFVDDEPAVFGNPMLTLADPSSFTGNQERLITALLWSKRGWGAAEILTASSGENLKREPLTPPSLLDLAILPNPRRQEIKSWSAHSLFFAHPQMGEELRDLAQY